MAAERQKIKIQDLKDHFNKSMAVEIAPSNIGEGPSTYVYGHQVDPKDIPALVIEDLKKLGFLNSLKIDMK
jgi:hypothetical protein